MSKEKKNSIDSLYEQTMLIAKQVEQLKKEVIGEQTYSFTKQQLKEFSDSLYDNFVQFQNSEISEIEFSQDSVQLELEDNVIVVSIDSSVISDEIENSSSSPDDSEMDNMIKEILESMEIELH